MTRLEALAKRLRAIEAELGLGDYAEAEPQTAEEAPAYTPGIRYRVVQPAPWEIQPHYRGGV